MKGREGGREGERVVCTVCRNLSRSISGEPCHHKGCWLNSHHTVFHLGGGEGGGGEGGEGVVSIEREGGSNNKKEGVLRERERVCTLVAVICVPHLHPLPPQRLVAILRAYRCRWVGW